MHILMTMKQFEELIKKAGGKDEGDKDKETKDDKGAEGDKGEKDLRGKDSKDKGEQKGYKVSIKQDDDTTGTLETEDFNISYSYNMAEGRLYLGPVVDRKTLAGFLANDTNAAEYLMYKMSQKVATKDKPKDGGAAPVGEEKKDQKQDQPPAESQPTS